jgi:hypothetical protein
MKLAQWTALAALTGAIFAFAPAASAADAKLTDCLNLARQVTAALETAQPGDATDAARGQATAGRTACLASSYKLGVAHYSRALQLLGKS